MCQPKVREPIIYLLTPESIIRTDDILQYDKTYAQDWDD